MATLYITEQGSILRKTGDRIIVEKDDQVLLEVPCHKVDTVLIFGAVQVTIQALSELLEHEIELALFTRHGRLKGQLTPIKSKNIVLRVAQFERAREAAFALTTARELVRAKIGNAIVVLRRFAYNHPERKAALDAEVTRLHTHLTTLDQAQDLAALNGLEGIAGRAYFAGFAQMILADLPFPGRRRRPAPDPVNALLSFGYTLIGNELHSLLDGMGFDPYIGFLHQIDYGRPSLALDLLEEFRHPLVDRLTLALINKRILQGTDFALDPASGSMHLKPDAMKVYFRHFERWMLEERVDASDGQTVSFRRAFQLQSHRLAEAIKNGAVYQPFCYGADD